MLWNKLTHCIKTDVSKIKSIMRCLEPKIKPNFPQTGNLLLKQNTIANPDDSSFYAKTNTTPDSLWVQHQGFALFSGTTNTLTATRLDHPTSN